MGTSRAYGDFATVNLGSFAFTVVLLLVGVTTPQESYHNMIAPLTADLVVAPFIPDGSRRP
jgi:hypothetical protein